MKSNTAKHLIFFLGIIFSLILFSANSLCANKPGDPKIKEPEVKIYKDENSAGWMEKLNDVAFVIEVSGCKLQWNAIEFKPDDGEKNSHRDLVVKRSCELPFAEQLPYHRQILKKIAMRWDLKNFSHLSWGSFTNRNDFSWNIPVALASWKSADYQDYRKHYPHSKIKGLNLLFVELANQTQAYDPLAKLFLEFGISIELESVEKVFTSKVSDWSYSLQLKTTGIPASVRLITDVGESAFSIKPNTIESNPYK